jgi:hypothetical protein
MGRRVAMLLPEVSREYNSKLLCNIRLVLGQILFARNLLIHFCGIGCTCSAADQTAGSTAEPRDELSAPHSDHGGTPPTATAPISPPVEGPSPLCLLSHTRPSLLVAHPPAQKFPRTPPLVLSTQLHRAALLPAIRPTSQLTACAQRDFRSHRSLARDTEHTSQPRAVPYTIPPR